MPVAVPWAWAVRVAVRGVVPCRGRDKERGRERGCGVVRDRHVRDGRDRLVAADIRGLRADGVGAVRGLGRIPEHLVGRSGQSGAEVHAVQDELHGGIAAGGGSKGGELCGAGQGGRVYGRDKRDRRRVLHGDRDGLRVADVAGGIIGNRPEGMRAVRGSEGIPEDLVGSGGHGGAQGHAVQGELHLGDAYVVACGGR